MSEQIDPASCRRRRQREARTRRSSATTTRSASSSPAAASTSTRSPTRSRQFAVAVPSWGVGTGGTRFARFPGAGEPRNIFDKLEDCAVIQQLTGATPTVSLHIPWDKADDPSRLQAGGDALGLGFDAMNSNTFSDAPGQTLSYKFGSLQPHRRRRRARQAVEHNLECIEIGQAIGSKALTVWIGDGSNFPGQVNFTKRLRALSRRDEGDLRGAARRLAALLRAQDVRAGLLFDGGAGLGHQLPDRHGARRRRPICLVDLGHHAPNVNIEMIVARLIQFGKLGGFHFNDSKYGDDDLDAGSIDPYRLFLVFNELVDAEHRGAEGFHPAHMLDQSTTSPTRSRA